MSSVTRASREKKLALLKHCSRERVFLRAKAAVVATVVAAIPTLASVKMLPRARANLNPTAQALIISAATTCSCWNGLLHSSRQDGFGFGPKNSFQTATAAHHNN